MKQIFAVKQDSGLVLAVLLVSAFTLASVASASVSFNWGIQPFKNNVAAPNALVDASGDLISPDDFNAKYELVLAYLGGDDDGEEPSFDPDTGFSELKWIDTASAQSASARFGSDLREACGDLYIGANTTLEDEWIEFSDDWDWGDVFFGVFVREKATKRVFRLSEEAGGIDFLGIDQLSVNVFDPRGGGGYRPLILRPKLKVEEDESVLVYIGAELPLQCVWMANHDLMPDDIADMDAEEIALAIESEFASGSGDSSGSLSLKIMAFTVGAESAEISWSLESLDDTGAATPVASLSDGLQLVLKTASSLEALKTDAAARMVLDPSVGKVTISTSGEKFFAQLVVE